MSDNEVAMPAEIVIIRRRAVARTMAITAAHGRSPTPTS